MGSPGTIWFDPFNLFGLADRRRSTAGPQRQQQAIEHKQTTIARRGAWLPLCIGRNRIGPTVLAAGNRFSIQEVIGETVSGGGGGKGGGGDEPEIEKIYQTVYFEDRWDGLCIGPLDRIVEIYVDGKQVLNSPISRPESSLPNPVDMGARFNVKGSGHPNIYWGNCDQPNTPTGSPFSEGVASLLDGDDSGNPESAWPWLAFIYWDNFRQGASPVWPSIDYECEFRLKNSPLTASAAWMDESAVGRGDWGVNPAHLILWLATAPSPWGAAMLTSDWNKQSLEDFGELCQAEHLVMNFLIENGEEATTAISDVLKDAGAALAEVNGQVHITPIREVVPANLPVLDDEVIIGTEPENKIDLDPRPSTRLDFEFRSKDVKLRTYDFALEDDSLTEKGFGFRKITKVPLRTITNLFTAARVADRRAMEELGNLRTFSADVLHGGHKMIPGQALILDGIGTVRVTGRKLNALNDVVQVDFTDDHFGVPVGTVDIEEDDGFTPIFAEDAEEDVVFQVIDAPRLAAPGVIRYFMGRHRANSQIEGAAIHFSNDDATYDQVGIDRSNMAGGALQSDLGRFDATEIEDGPIVDASDIQEADLLNVLDLTGDDAGMFAGKQVAIIGSEVCYFRQFDELGAGLFQLKGFVRARVGTIKGDHSAGARVFITSPDRFQTLGYINAIPGADVFVKGQPFVSNEIVDLGTVSPVTFEVFGRGIRPLPLGFLDCFTNGAGARRARTYVTSQDIQLNWSYRLIDLARPTAGTVLPGTAVSEIDAPPDGGMRIEFRTAAGALPNANISSYDGVSYSNTSASTILFTRAQMQAKTVVVPNAFIQNNFGGQPTSFIMRGYQRSEDASGSISQYESEAFSITIKREDQAVN